MQAPEGAKLVTIRLAVPESSGPRQPGYLAQRSPEAVEETASVPPPIVQAYAGKEVAVFEFAALPSGTRYLTVLNEDKSLKFLNRTEYSPTWCYARVYKVAGGSDPKPELLREGYQLQGNDVVFPVELELPGLGATKVKSLRTEVGYSFNGFQNGKPQVYTGRGAGVQVTGSQATQEGKLTLAVSVPEELVPTPDTQVTLMFSPFKPGLPGHTAAGKVTDFLTLGAARFVVTEIAPDFSSATLAVVAGSLEETLEQQLQLGAQMPAFAQVELLTRKTCTREQLLERAKSASGVIFVFGDLVSSAGRYGPPHTPSMGGGFALPLPAAEVAEQLGLEQKLKPVVVFVTRSIGIDFLYQDLRNKTPDYLVLADFADPLRTNFRAPTGPGGYYGPSYAAGYEPSLRQLLNLPERLAIAVFDRTGKVVYVKADAGNEFLSAAAEARAALKE